MTLFILIIIVIALIMLYRRYFPVLGIRELNWNEQNFDVLKIDVRHYNESYRNPIPGAINLPIAYFYRYYTEIHKKDIHVIASDTLEKNYGIRLLHKKGFRVIGYTITNSYKLVDEDPINIKTTC